MEIYNIGNYENLREEVKRKSRKIGVIRIRDKESIVINFSEHYNKYNSVSTREFLSELENQLNDDIA